MYIKPTKEMQKVAIENGYSCLEALRGYDIYDFDNTGLLEVKKIDAVFNGWDGYEDVDDEACARQAQKCGYCSIIPVDELPENMMYKGENLRYYGWVDTYANRKNICDFFSTHREV